MIAKIAVAAAVYAIDKPYSYQIPQTLDVRPGMRVLVPFGRGNRRSEGIVLALELSEEKGLKWVERTLDETPILDDGALRLAAFIRERYFCTFYDAIKAMLPAGLWFTVVDRYTVTPEAGQWPQIIKRQPLASQIMQALTDFGGQAEYAQLKKQFPDENALQTALRYLLGKKLIQSDADLLPRTGEKTELLVELAAASEEAMSFAERKRKSAPLQFAALELLCTIGRGSTKEVCYFTGCSMATLRRLEKLGYLTFSKQQVLRAPAITKQEPQSFSLNAEQQSVFDGLLAQSREEKPGVALLYGVTGSGKTAVYLRLIEATLAQERSAILLVPEIALTPQFLSLFAAHFGQTVAVLHSSLRVGERYDEWQRIRSGKARVVIGTRSAVFAPVQNLGILIVDEEQEHTYKSENAPRYHAREIACYRGLRDGALVLLGSATPSMETMYHALSGDYALYRLPNRFNGKKLPAVEIVDMKQEIKDGNGSSISTPLEHAMQDAIAAGRQVILFLNRRGASRLLVCVDCGHVPTCPRCSVHLTYHAANRRLMCHYCGHSEPLAQQCPQCGGHLKQVGAGTQRVEEELSQRFAGHEVLRMDADTVSAVNNHEKLLSRFVDEKIPILVGTQMVAKGLNFENVTLVGVLDADMSLYVDNFRAAENTFSMITQVIGRAGRGTVGGKALIQTMTPDNAVIALAAAQDYDGFFNMEIQLRKLRSCPPFRDLISVTFVGAFEDQALAGALRFRDALAAALRQPIWSDLAMQVLGPAPAVVAKVNNLYRYRLTLSCRNSRNLRRLVAQLLRDFAKDRRSKGVSAFADVNSFD